MDLLTRIAPHDSIDEMEAAREDRYSDSLTCALDGREFAACYLMGYVIEMLLKSAFYRFDGVPLVADLRGGLRSARKHPRFKPVTGSPSILAHGLHNIRAWGDHLIDTRQRTGRALDVRVASRLVYELCWVQNNWSETLRYRRSIPASDEVHRFLKIADWLRSEYVTLWS